MSGLLKLTAMRVTIVLYTLHMTVMCKQYFNVTTGKGEAN